ncbi:MAG: hypothetical protein QM744_14335 [Mesorhizobium sp.]
MIAKKTPRKKIEMRQAELRQQVFGEINPKSTWNRLRATGFTTIPRTIPLLGAIMDGLAGKGKPVSRTYLELWSRANDDGFAVLSKQHDIAFASGFTTQRAVSTWKERLRLLEELWFIKTAPGTSGSTHYVQIWNPYLVVKAHREAKTAGFLTDHYNALFERMQEIGATDFDD